MQQQYTLAHVFSIAAGWFGILEVNCAVLQSPSVVTIQSVIDLTKFGKKLSYHRGTT